MTPPRLAPRLQSLPPILHKKCPESMSTYSKAARGLIVLPQLIGIFTDIVISPGLCLRQCPYHYSFRAGRNLPDKEFRYLRTVIVTAAVHQGLDSKLAPLLVTFWHRAGVSPYTSSYDLARTCVFDKQLHGLFRCGLPLHKCIGRQGLSRSYACCFAEFLKHSSPDHLGLLDPPTRVGLRYGIMKFSERGFSCLLNLQGSVLADLYITFRELERIYLLKHKLDACTQIH